MTRLLFSLACLAALSGCMTGMQMNPPTLPVDCGDRLFRGESCDVVVPHVEQAFMPVPQFIRAHR